MDKHATLVNEVEMRSDALFYEILGEKVLEVNNQFNIIPKTTEVTYNKEFIIPGIYEDSKKSYVKYFIDFYYRKILIYDNVLEKGTYDFNILKLMSHLNTNEMRIMYKLLHNTKPIKNIKNYVKSIKSDFIMSDKETHTICNTYDNICDEYPNIITNAFNCKTKFSKYRIFKCIFEIKTSRKDIEDSTITGILQRLQYLIRHFENKHTYAIVVASPDILEQREIDFLRRDERIFVKIMDV